MVFPTAVRKPLRLSDPCFAVFTPYVGFKPVFRPVAINLVNFKLKHEFHHGSLSFSESDCTTVPNLVPL